MEILLILVPICCIILTAYNEIYAEKTTTIMKICDVVLCLFFAFSTRSYILLANAIVLIALLFIARQKTFDKRPILLEIVLSIMCFGFSFSDEDSIAIAQVVLVILVVVCKLFSIFRKSDIEE